MMHDKLIAVTSITFVIAWVFTLIATLVGTGLVVYILWRIATSTWL